MNEVILTFPEHVKLSDVGSMLSKKWRIMESKLGLAIEENDDRVYIRENDEYKSVIHEPEMLSDAFLKEYDKLENPKLLFIPYHGSRLVQAIVRHLASSYIFVADSFHDEDIIESKDIPEVIDADLWPS